MGVELHVKKISILCAFFSLALCACLPDEQLSSLDAEQNMRSAQVETQTSAIMNIALMAQEKLTAGEDWANGTAPQGIVDVATPGGNATGIVSAYCSDNSGDKAYSLTWASKGSVSNGDMQVGLIKSAKAENVMTYNNGKLKPASGAASFRLSDTCISELNITDNSPVLVMALRQPLASTEKQIKVTFESGPCDSGKVGYVMNKVVATYAASGSLLSKKSEAVSQNCNAVGIAKDLDLKDSTATIALATGAMPDGNIKGVLTEGLSNMGCLKADEKAKDKTDKTKNLNITDTCAVSQVNLQGMAAIKDQDLGSVTETREVVCNAGHNGSAAEAYQNAGGMKYWGVWSGKGTLTRKVHLMSADDGVAKKDYRSNDPWVGDTLDCQRDETLEISCASMMPTGTNVTLIENVAFEYRRTLKVEGWADKKNFIPAKAGYVGWNYVKGNCVWTIEYDDEECKPGYPLLETKGMKKQVMKTSPGEAKEVGWNKVVKPRCYNETNETTPVVECARGTVIEQGQQTRINKNYDDGITSNGAWKQDSAPKCGEWRHIVAAGAVVDEVNNGAGATKWYYIATWPYCYVDGVRSDDSACTPTLPKPNFGVCVFPAMSKYNYLMYGPGGCGNFMGN